MRRLALAIAAAASFGSTASAQTPPHAPALSGLGFLIGRWTDGTGKVADTGGTSRGSSVISTEVGGAVLLRRDHTDLFDASGKAAGGFDQIMMIYPEGGSLHADYSDGVHIIHYRSAVVVPGQSVVFTSEAQPGSPVFKLSYALKAADTLDISFAMAPPGQTEFHAIATGALHRAP